MASTSKTALKPHVARWLDELDTCFEERKEWSPTARRFVKREVLRHPPLAEHIGRLHDLIESDYSPLVARSEVDEYIRKLEKSGKGVPLARKEFPADYYWTIIKKWDRWRKLRVIKRIERYVRLLPEFWENQWRLHGGSVSPYTREWIHYKNLADQYAFVYGCEPDAKRRAELDRKFPAVAVMQRIERGGAARGTDIKILERWASPWSKEHSESLYQQLNKRLRQLDNRAELRKEPIENLIEELRDGVGALYAAVLAKEIQARHERALVAVHHWENGWGMHVSGYFSQLGNEEYIKRLLPILPLLRVGSPRLEQEKRIKKAKRASGARRKSVRVGPSLDELFENPVLNAAGKEPGSKRGGAKGISREKNQP
jgi:hypothetical protein